jgi:hypothetical protein
MAGTFVAIWVFIFANGSSLEVQLGYLAFALAFLGLMVLGPGRFALRSKRE